LHGQSNLSLNCDFAGMDSIYELEMLHLKDMGNYIYNFLLPRAKQYLAGNTRKKKVSCRFD